MDRPKQASKLVLLFLGLDFLVLHHVDVDVVGRVPVVVFRALGVWRGCGVGVVVVWEIVHGDFLGLFVCVCH
jgi:hypothetical protein